MIFRLRQYKVEAGKIDVFNSFFKDYLLPVQQRHGAKLIGRWQTNNGSQIAALWVYDNQEHYKTTQENVRNDPDAAKAQEHRKANLNPLFTEKEEAFMTSTVALELTELAHLKNTNT